VGRLIDHVFGYGSLAGDLLAGGSLARLPGYRRVWGVAADNAHAIPGYKQYRLRSDGTVPRLFVAFLDIVEDSDRAVSGVVAPADDARLAELDRRERNYDRIDVTATIDSPAEGRVWTYVGSEPGRNRLAQGVREGRAVVSRDYLGSVRSAFRQLGDDESDDPLASAELDSLPVLDLERIDLPPEARP
jgi:Gamma-glutamyl cyclotransferase, AIG2-like